MTQEQNFNDYIVSLLSRAPEITGAKLSIQSLNSWLIDLEHANDEPEKLANAWSPILTAINENYCYGKFSENKYELIDPRKAISVVIKKCMADLDKVVSTQNRRTFAEQIAYLLVVQANLSHCYPSGHPMVYAAFCSAMNDAEKFIHKYELLYTGAHGSWCYLKAFGALKSYGVVSEELYCSRANLEGDRKQLATVTDEESKQELISSIQLRNRAIQDSEKRLQTYSYDGIRNLGTAYCISIREVVTKPYVLGSLAVVGALVGYSLRQKPKM